MSQEFVNQVVLWVIGGAAGALGLILMAIGKWIVSRVDQVSTDVAASRQESHDEIAGMRKQFSDDLSALRKQVTEDMGQVRERLARVEGAIFPAARRE